MSDRCADLHTHTIFSDGTSTPEELVASAARLQLDAVAVTDHDCTGGILDAAAAGLSCGVEVIPGIELTCEHAGSEVHVLGFFIDLGNPSLVRQLEFLKNARIERVQRMVEKLNGLGVALETRDVFETAGLGTVGRLHVARALVNRGFIGATWEAFHKYIGDKGPAYVLGFKLSAGQAISLIRDAGGIAVLAHPYCLGGEDVIAELVEMGIRGIEAYYPEHSPAMVKSYLAFAAKKDLLVTGGSDFHGSAKPDVRLGSVKVDYKLVERLKKAAAHA